MTIIKFLPLAVDPRAYPYPLLSMLPSGTATQVNFITHANKHCRLSSEHEFYTYGRYALVEAFRRAGVTRGVRILMPAYHCRTIIESALFLQADVIFYPMLENLEPDFSALKQLVQDQPIKAMLLTHYFGFPNNTEAVNEFCCRHGITLIEDCAHAFYGQQSGKPLGSVGQFSIASAWKFLPLRDGAVLIDNRPHSSRANYSASLRPAPFISELKAIASLVLNIASRHRRPTLSTVDFAALASQTRVLAAIPVPQAPEEVQFKGDYVDAHGLRVSHWLARHAPHEQIIAKRRTNYLHWLDGMVGIEGVTPLFPSLPMDIAPYAFPLLVDTDGLAFHAFKLAGIPIWRWEDVATTTCPVSSRYRLRLLQLPCHQDLSSSEIDWMTTIIRGVIPHLVRDPV